MFRLASFVTFAVLVVALAGCSGEGADRLAVNGTVSFKGAPLAQGSISFDLDDRANPFVSGATIEDGKFTIPRAQGLKAGTYLVRISSADPIVKDVNQAPGEPQVAQERIPASWNTESKEKVEVKAGATDLTFDVK